MTRFQLPRRLAVTYLELTNHAQITSEPRKNRQSLLAGEKNLQSVYLFNETSRFYARELTVDG